MFEITTDFELSTVKQLVQNARNRFSQRVLDERFDHVAENVIIEAINEGERSFDSLVALAQAITWKAGLVK